MSEVTIRELRNRGGEVIDRVAAGEHVVVTRDGRPMAEMRPVAGPGPRAAALVERWKGLPIVDGSRLRGDLDAAIDRRL